MAGQATPAIVVLARQRVAHRVHTYSVDADTPNYGAAVAEAMGVAPERVFKTLVTEVDGVLTVAVVPVTGDVDLKALAAISGRDYVIPDDVKQLAVPVLGHRLIVRSQASLREVDNDAIVREILTTVPIAEPTEAGTPA